MPKRRLLDRGLWLQPTVAVGMLVMWILWLYREDAISMASIWYHSSTFTHGFLVAPIAGWLIWRRRRELVGSVPQASALALTIVFAVSIVWFAGFVLAANALVQFAVVGLIISAFLVTFGWKSCKVIAFPLGFLLFSVPVGNFLLPLLMDWTADFTVLALRVTGIPVHREGLQFVIPSGTWSVIEACSGVRYLIASLTIGTLFSYLTYRSWTRRLLFVVVSALVPILANWLRAYLIVLLGHLSGNELATGVDHLVYGWLFFGVVVMVMFTVGSWWREPDMGPARKDVQGPASCLRLEATHGGLRLWAPVVAAAVVIAAPHVAAEILKQRVAESGGVSFHGPASLKDGWRRTSVDIASWKPIFNSPSARFRGAFQKAGALVGLDVAYYRNQSFHRKLFSSSNVLVTSDSHSWRVSAVVTKSTGCGERRIKINQTILKNAAEAVPGDLTVWQYYWVDGAVVSNSYLAQIYGAYSYIAGNGNGSASIIAYSRGEGAERALMEFLRSNCNNISDGLNETNSEQSSGY